MLVPPVGEDDRLAKAALFTKYTGELGASAASWVLQLQVHARRSLHIKNTEVQATPRDGGIRELKRGLAGPLLMSPKSPGHPFPAAETLPVAVGRWRQLGVPLLLELLGGIRAAVGTGGSGERSYAQGLFCQAQACLQVCNVLNEEYSQVG